MRRVSTLLGRLAALSWGQRGFLFEAVVAVGIASLVIAVVPFRNVTRLAAWPRCRTPIEPGSRNAVRERVRWAVTASAHSVPWRAMCFPQGLAAQWMLRRRGILSTLHYGASPDAHRGVAAHVWVCDGDFRVIGGEAAIGMALLASFPADGE